MVRSLVALVGCVTLPTRVTEVGAVCACATPSGRARSEAGRPGRAAATGAGGEWKQGASCLHLPRKVGARRRPQHVDSSLLRTRTRPGAANDGPYEDGHDDNAVVDGDAFFAVDGAGADLICSVILDRARLTVGSDIGGSRWAIARPDVAVRSAPNILREGRLRRRGRRRSRRRLGGALDVHLDDGATDVAIGCESHPVRKRVHPRWVTSVVARAVDHRIPDGEVRRRAAVLVVGERCIEIGRIVARFAEPKMHKVGRVGLQGDAACRAEAVDSVPERRVRETTHLISGARAAAVVDSDAVAKDGAGLWTADLDSDLDPFRVRAESYAPLIQLMVECMPCRTAGPPQPCNRLRAW